MKIALVFQTRIYNTIKDNIEKNKYTDNEHFTVVFNLLYHIRHVPNNPLRRIQFHCFLGLQLDQVLLQLQRPLLQMAGGLVYWWLLLLQLWMIQ